MAKLSFEDFQPGADAFEPAFSERGNERLRRHGETILSRGAIGEPAPIPLSRIEKQGQQFPIETLTDEFVKDDKEVTNG